MTPNPVTQLAPVTLFQVQSSVSAGTDEGRWIYTVRPASNFDAVVDAAGSWTVEYGEVESYDFVGLNVYELGNTTTNHMGIALSSLPGTYAVQPIPDDRIVPGIMIDPEDPKVILFWPNQFDGACS